MQPCSRRGSASGHSRSRCAVIGSTSGGPCGLSSIQAFSCCSSNRRIAASAGRPRGPARRTHRQLCTPPSRPPSHIDPPLVASRRCRRRTTASSGRGTSPGRRVSSPTAETTSRRSAPGRAFAARLCTAVVRGRRHSANVLRRRRPLRRPRRRRGQAALRSSRNGMKSTVPVVPETQSSVSSTRPERRLRVRVASGLPQGGGRPPPRPAPPRGGSRRSPGRSEWTCPEPHLAVRSPSATSGGRGFTRGSCRSNSLGHFTAQDLDLAAAGIACPGDELPAKRFGASPHNAHAQAGAGSRCACAAEAAAVV